ncbi:hypothetical protein BJ742DRAFT_825586 [Cladochytrium replicatum]|nr:hypothetical protein BJ742DRAFT_825586 [Cladochytrium replicatum]
MTEKKEVLIAIDDSDSGEYTLNWAFSNVLTDGDHATVVTVTRPPNSITAAGALAGSLTTDVRVHYLSEAEDMALTGLQSLVNSVRSKYYKNVEVQLSAQVGEPKQVIVQMAKQVKPTMLLVGSRHTSIGLLTGSVSHYLAHHCECPVVIVKKPVLA